MITFAVAAYNIENFIETCLDSIIEQSKDKFEILVIDDGSTDKTGKICDMYAAADDRIKVIHQENRGVSAVRNLAIDHAEGDWICFVDGDDKLDKDAYKLLTESIDDRFDIVYFDLQFFVYDKRVSKYVDYCDPMILNGTEINRLMLSTMYSANGSENFINKNLRSVCAKAIKTDLLRKNKLRFNEELTYAEDVIFNIECLKCCNWVKLIRRPFYLYRQRQESAVHKYTPLIGLHNKKLAELLRQCVGDDKEMLSRYYMRCIADMGTVIMLDICHRNNPKSYEQRKKDYEELLLMPWWRTALENVDFSLLKDAEKRIYDLIMNCSFDSVYKYYINMYKIEKMKIFINKIGLNIVLKPIRDTIRKIKR